MVGIHGMVPRDQYEKMINEEHWGLPTPLDFHGYNTGSPWPFWSSEPFTQASTILALSKYRVLNTNT